MDGKGFWRLFSWAPVILFVILPFGTLISFIIAFSRGDVSIYLPFISETGAMGPQMSVFSFFLIFGSFFGCLVVCFRYLVLRHQIAIEYGHVQKLNYLTLFMGLGSMGGLAGVAAFPVSTIFWAHLLAAGIHFTLAVAYLSLQTYLMSHIPDRNEKLWKLRIFINLLVVILLFLLVIIFPVAFNKWKRLNNKLPALKTPDDEGFGLMFTGTLFEWLMYFGFLSYLLTFIVEFRKFTFAVTAAPVQKDTEINSGEN